MVVLRYLLMLVHVDHIYIIIDVIVAAAAFVVVVYIIL